jgi:HSP20 family protein
MLLRYDPFREIDRFTNGFFRHRDWASWMPMDAVRKDDRVELRFDLPGVRPDSIDLTVEHNVLTVKAERSSGADEDSETLAHERTWGSFYRQVRLGEALDADRVEARYEDGVLHVTVPVAETAKPRKVEIQTGEARSIDVGSGN